VSLFGRKAISVAQYNSDSLDVVLDEVRRARELQSSRMGALRSRAGVLISASGLAAGLVSSVSANGWWLLPLCAFGVAAVLGTLSLVSASAYVVSPRLSFDLAEGTGPTQVKVNTITGIISEFETQEKKSQWQAVFGLLGVSIFLLAVVLLVVVVACQIIHPVTGEPTLVRIVK
jgi:MFS family permease